MGRRTERLNDLLRAEISVILQRQVKDPRLAGFLSITEVAVSPDLRYARVYVSIMGSESEKKETLSGLSAAAGFLRHELRQRLTLRRIPELDFHQDDSIERGAHLLDMLRRLEGEGNTEEP